MIDFVEVVSRTFQIQCTQKYTIDTIDKNIIKVSFEKFALVLYYSAYEYDLGINFYRNSNECSFEQVLLSLGCSGNTIPAYKFMSNEEVMAAYLGEYIVLLNRYFSQLVNVKI